MTSRVSDFNDPELDELEPVHHKTRRKAKMATKHETEAAETQPYVLGQDVSVAGVDCKKGGTLQLTSEQAEAMKAAGVRFEGDEEPSPEDIQKKHDEGVEAQNEEIEKRKEEAEKAAKEAN